MIVTTNLTNDDFKKADDIGNARIYDRIMERCQPINAEGRSYRRQKLREEFGQTEMILTGQVNKK